MQIDVDAIPLWAIFLISMAMLLAACEFGRRLGTRVAKQGRDNVSTLEGAVLGLLALLIGFTFAMALSRFDARRDAVLNEANAIGTTALRAQLLSEPSRGNVLRLVREYVKVRLDVTQHDASIEELEAAIARSEVIQEELWQQAKAAMADNSDMVPTGLFIQSLNEMIDQHEKRITALRTRVPDIVIIALYGLATVAAAFTGYACGIEARTTKMPIYTASALIACVLLLIQDLDRPTAGFLRTSQQPMIDVYKSISPGQGG